MATGGCAPPKQEYDFSVFPYPGELKTFSSNEIAVKVTLGVLVELVALVGNILVITIVLRSRSMRTTTNYYLVNLAVSDLLVGLMPIWVHIVSSLNEFWVFGSFLCKFNPFLQITAMCASMFTLIVLAGDRFYAIMFPMHSRVNKRKVSYLLIAVWLASCAIATPLLFVYTYIERQWADVLETYCDERWPMKMVEDNKCDGGLTSKKAYWIVVCCVLNWTPMVCTTLAYTFIVIKLRKHKIGPKLGASTRSTVQQRSKRKVVIMLFSVLILFIVCAVPFQTIKIYFMFTQGTPGYKLPSWFGTLDFGAILLMYSNAAINPIIYAGFNESFRNGFKDLINTISNRRRPTASDSFESEFKQRSMLRAKNGSIATISGSRGSRAALLEMAGIPSSENLHESGMMRNLSRDSLNDDIMPSETSERVLKNERRTSHFGNGITLQAFEKEESVTKIGTGDLALSSNL